MTIKEHVNRNLEVIDINIYNINKNLEEMKNIKDFISDAVIKDKCDADEIATLREKYKNLEFENTILSEESRENAEKAIRIINSVL